MTVPVIPHTELTPVTSPVIPLNEDTPVLISVIPLPPEEMDIPVDGNRLSIPVNPLTAETYAVIPGLYESHADPFQTHVRPAKVYCSFTAGDVGKFKGIG